MLLLTSLMAACNVLSLLYSNWDYSCTVLLLVKRYPTYRQPLDSMCNNNPHMLSLKRHGMFISSASNCHTYNPSL
jgi:hypothetical protein